MSNNGKMDNSGYTNEECLIPPSVFNNCIEQTHHAKEALEKLQKLLAQALMIQSSDKHEAIQGFIHQVRNMSKDLDALDDAMGECGY